MKQYQYYLLDWDGNLAQTLHIWRDAVRQVCAARGVEVSDHQIGISFGSFESYMLEWGIIDPDEAMNEAVKIAKDLLPKAELYPDAIEVLQLLHENGKKLALVTSSSHEHIKHLLEKHHIAEFFDVIIGREDTDKHKPNPEPLEKALTALGGVKDKAVMIGDSDKDLGAANTFGVDSILFFPPEHHDFYNYEHVQTFHPTHTVADFREILQSL